MKPVPEMLRRCGPLMDAVQFAVSLMLWTTATGLVLVSLPSFVSLWQNPDKGYAQLLAIVTALELLVVAAHWLLLNEAGGKKDLCMFLRAFRSDASSDQLRAWLKAALGVRWRLAGIRPPAERAPFWETLLSPMLTGLRYFGSRQFEMVAPDHNWMARLLATFDQARLACVDFRDVTNHVLDEIQLAWLIFGRERTIFIVDEARTEADWRTELQRLLGGSSSDFRLLSWPSEAPRFVTSVQQLIEVVPEGTAEVPRAAVEFVHERVGEAEWDIRPMDRGLVIGLVQQGLLGAVCFLLWLVHPMLMRGALGVLGLVGLSYFRQAWSRARKQRKHAMQINPAGPPSALRLWSSLALMVSVVILPWVMMFVASFHLLKAPVEEPPVQRAREDLQSLELALMQYEAYGSGLPTSEQGLQALIEKPISAPQPRNWRQLLDEIPVDPWGRAYRFEAPAKRSTSAGYDLWSAGPDGQDGTADDVGNFKISK